jgi:hypothetical protein
VPGAGFEVLVKTFALTRHPKPNTQNPLIFWKSSPRNPQNFCFTTVRSSLYTLIEAGDARRAAA